MINLKSVSQTAEHFRGLALRHPSAGDVSKLHPFERQVVRATEWLLLEFSQLIESSTEPYRSELDLYITQAGYASHLVDGCIVKLYKYMYVYTYVYEGGLTDDHLAFIARTLVYNTLMAHPQLFDRRAVPEEALNSALDVDEFIAIFEAIVQDGLIAVKARIVALAAENHQRVQQKATFILE